MLTYSNKAIYAIITMLCAFLSTVALAQNAKLIDYQYIGDFTTDQANTALHKLPVFSQLNASHTLQLYKIHYYTPSPDGNISVASGLVAMPSSPSKKVAIVSFQHGTRVTRSDVPSNNDERNHIYPAVFGSHGGFMVVMPDYLGLGDNALSLHPYVQDKTLASSSIDMLLAAKELAAKLNYPINEKLFLAGYSEGGFTTTVMYEALLKNNSNLTVTAVAPGSAPYDWNETMNFIINEPGPRATTYLALFFYSMQTYHHYWESLDKIFIKPYDTLIPVLFDGAHQITEILEALPKDPKQILQPSFFEAILSGKDINTTSLINNMNHYQFKSTSPLLLVGTKGDHDVPYHGAEIAYEHLKSRSETVYIKNVSDTLDHIQAMPLVLKEQLDFFKQYNH